MYSDQIEKTTHPGLKGRMIWREDGGVKKYDDKCRQEFITLLQTYGSIAKLAEHLKISRQAVHSKVRRLGIDYKSLKKDIMGSKFESILNKIRYYVYECNLNINETACKLGIKKPRLVYLLTKYISARERNQRRNALKHRIAMNIRRLRIEKNITQEELSEKTGFFQEYFSRVEKEKLLPENKSLSKIAHVLGVTLSDIVEPKGDVYADIGTVGQRTSD